MGNLLKRIFSIILALFLLGCASQKAAKQKVTLIYRDWADVVPQAVLEDFERTHDIHVDYMPYDTQEDAIAEIRSGQPADILVVENQLVPGLVEDGLLAKINLQNIPNFKNVSANFRDMAYDSGNWHSIPYSWGTTGIVVRTDKISKPISRWADLWELETDEKIVLWNLPRYTIGMALRSLGYSINSEDPAELEQALDALIALKPRIILVEWEPAVSTSYLSRLEAVAGMAQADDQYAADVQGLPVKYFLPQDGALLWGDNYTILAASEHQAEAEIFINYLLQAEVAARIINETHYWLPNDAALPLVDPSVRNNLAVFPDSASLKGAEVIMPLSPEGEALYADVWERFLTAQP